MTGSHPHVRLPSSQSNNAPPLRRRLPPSYSRWLDRRPIRTTYADLERFTSGDANLDDVGGIWTYDRGYDRQAARITVETSADVRSSAVSPDDALVRRARLGDVAAFDALIATRLDRCYRLAWSIVVNDADAADATQEGFVAAWRQLPRLRDTASFDSWLNRIVSNAARMSRRHRIRLREIRMPVEEPGSGARGPGDPMDDRQARTQIDDLIERDAIGRAFERLDPDQRVLLVLHHVESQPVAEIARFLGVPIGTAKWRLHRARRALERAMEAEA
jgi:RNA polymerase sigma-70 factor (ECF subfamily)